MSEMRAMAFKFDDRDRRLLRRVARRTGSSLTDALRWALRYYALYGPCWPEGDTFPGEVLRDYGRVEVGPNGQEVRS